MNKTIEKLKCVNEDKAKESLIRVFEAYLEPSFGAMPKRDIDLLLFSELYTLGVFSNQSKTELFDVISNLRVTRQKARNLIYESQLRAVEGINLQDELCELLSNPIVEKVEQINLEVDNPLLMDYLKSKMKELHCLTDGSFNQDIVKMKVESFSKLLQDCFEIKKNRDVGKRLVELGLKEGTKDVFVDVIKNSIKKVLGDAASGVVGDIAGDAFKWIMECLDKKSS